MFFQAIKFFSTVLVDEIKRFAGVLENHKCIQCGFLRRIRVSPIFSVKSFCPLCQLGRFRRLVVNLALLFICAFLVPEAAALTMTISRVVVGNVVQQTPVTLIQALRGQRVEIDVTLTNDLGLPVGGTNVVDIDRTATTWLAGSPQFATTIDPNVLGGYNIYFDVPTNNQNTPFDTALPLTLTATNTAFVTGVQTSATTGATVNIIRPTYGVTIVIHGFQFPDAVPLAGGACSGAGLPPPVDFVKMGEAVIARAGQGKLWNFNHITDTINPLALPAGAIRTAYDAQGNLNGEQVFVVNWCEISNNLFPGHAEEVAHSLFNALRVFDARDAIENYNTTGQGVLQSATPVHIIAHSFGTAVGFELARRIRHLLGNENFNLTFLDPHDFDQGMTVPVDTGARLPNIDLSRIILTNGNKPRTDVYYQTLTKTLPLIPAGRCVDYADNIDLAASGLISATCVADPNINCHTATHGFYRSTITPDGPITDYLGSVLNEAGANLTDYLRYGVGYIGSRIGGNAPFLAPQYTQYAGGCLPPSLNNVALPDVEVMDGTRYPFDNYRVFDGGFQTVLYDPTNRPGFRGRTATQFPDPLGGMIISGASLSTQGQYLETHLTAIASDVQSLTFDTTIRGKYLELTPGNPSYMSYAPPALPVGELKVWLSTPNAVNPNANAPTNIGNFRLDNYSVGTTHKVCYPISTQFRGAITNIRFGDSISQGTEWGDAAVSINNIELKTTPCSNAPTPVPSITSVSLPSPVASSSPQTMTINGSNFTNTSTLVFYYPSGAVSTAHPPATYATSQLTYTSNWPTAGAWKVKVVNGASESLPYTFNISPASPATVQLSGLSINGPPTVNESSNQTFTATALMSDGSNQTAPATWSVIGSAASIGVTSGQLSAGAVNSDTAVTISASYTLGGVTKTATYNVTIVNSGSGGPTQTQELISNVGFESGTTGWVMSGSVVPNTGLYPHTGTKYAVMAELNNNADTMYQAITIPANATIATLSYWYNILSDEPTSCFCDTLNVSIRNTIGTVLATVAIKSNADKDIGPGNPYYHQQTFDLLPYRGQTIWVHFRASTDVSYLSYFKIDDVSVQATVPQVATLTSLVINGPTSVAESSTAVYSATAVFSDGSTSIVTPTSWSVNSSGTISSSGIFTTNAVYANTPVIVSASYTSGGVPQSASQNVTVVDIPLVVVADTTPPTLPSNVTATAVSSSQINLSWGVSTDSGSGLAGYEIYRCAGVGCTNFAYLATTTLSSYNDTGLSASTFYAYQMRAYDNVGNLSNFTGTSSATTLASAVAVPSGCTISPVMSSVTTGASAQTFTASCSSGSPTSYAWTVDGSLVGGATNTYTTVANLALGPHTVAFTASNTSGTSNPATATTLTVSAATAPSCTISPATASVVFGTGQIFTATCTNGPTNYQWLLDGSLVGSGSINIYGTGTGLAVGSHTVTVTASNASGTGNTASATVTVSAPSSQTIAFGVAPTVAAGTTGTLSATATSGLAITFSSLTTSTCTVSGNTVTGVSAGTCTVAANQAGNSTYSVAAQVTQNISVTPASTGSTCVLQPSPGKDTHYGTVFRTAGMPDADYMSTGGWADQYFSFIEFDISTLPGATNLVSAEIWLHTNGADGTAIGGNDPVDKIYRITQPWTAVGVTRSNNPPSVFYSNAPPKPAISGWYRVDVTSLYRDWKNGIAPNYGIKIVPTVTNNNNGISFYTSEYADTTLRPKIVVTTSDASCAGGSSQPIIQTLTFGAQSSQMFSAGGTFAINPLATASSGLVPSYGSLTPSVCAVTNATVTMIAAGTCTIAANQTGNATYNAATQVTQNITVGYATSPNGVLSLTTTGASVNETGPTITLTVQRTGGSTGIITLPWSTGNGTAAAGTDYGTLGSAAQKTGTLTWAAGVTTPKTITIGLATANIPVINNTAVDSSRTFTVNLGTPTGSAVLGANTSATVTINDNDSTLAMAGPTATVAENGGNLILTVTRTGSIGTAASTTWSTVNGTALAGTHFGTARSLVQNSGTISWAAGDGAAKTITIPILNVPAAQGDKTFTVNLVTAAGATLSNSKSATVTITDQTRSLALAATAVPVNEGAGNATLTVNRSGNASGAVSVNYTTANGTATAGQDYTASTGTLNWADSDTAAKTISVPITDDTLVEPAETLTVTLSAPTGGATIAGLASATVTIADNDSNLQFGVPAASVSEKLAGILLTVTRTGSTSAPATVAWTATDGSATAGADYGASGSATLPGGTLTFAAGVMSQTISIPILADTLFEGNETFTVSLSGPTSATLGINPQVTVTLLDDEGGVQFEQPTYTVVEGTPSVVLKVLRIGPAATVAQTVKWTAANVEATAGADYGAVGNATLPSGTLTWAAGITTPKTITIPVTNDLAPEGDENFTVTLSNLTGGLAFSTPATDTTVTIWDNDSTPESTIEFNQAKYHLEEVQGNAVLTVTRNGDTHRPASVKWTASNGTAIAGSDYGTKGNVALPSGTLNWAAADGAPKTISIPIIDDITAEVMENFKITISGNSVSTVLGSLGKATVVIKDIDEVFPPTGNLPLLWTLPNPVAGWHVAEDLAAAEGKYVVRTDTVFDNEAAQIQVAGNFLAGNASFKLKVSSEEGFDFLRFYIDGVKKGEWSGNMATNWTITPNYPITAGPHVLLWSYEKDANTGLGQDAAWVDSVDMPAMVVP